jgi:hypothetical protein
MILRRLRYEQSYDPPEEVLLAQMCVADGPQRTGYNSMHVEFLWVTDYRTDMSAVLSYMYHARYAEMASYIAKRIITIEELTLPSGMHLIIPPKVKRKRR